MSNKINWSYVLDVFFTKLILLGICLFILDISLDIIYPKTEVYIQQKYLIKDMDNKTVGGLIFLSGDIFYLNMNECNTNNISNSFRLEKLDKGF
jgi:hypothetical protein